MQTLLMPRLIRWITALVTSIGLMAGVGVTTYADTAFAASSTSTTAAAMADTPSRGVSTANMPGNGVMVLYPAHVWAGVPFLLSVSSPATGVQTTMRVLGGTNTTVAVQYLAAQGATALGWREIQRDLTPADRGDAVTMDAEPRGMHIEYVWLSWWVTLPQVGQHTLRVEYVSTTQSYTSHQDISITAVRAPRHRALAVAYPYPPTYRVWPHPGAGTLPQQLTVVAAATGPHAAPMVETYDATVSRPTTLRLPLPAAVAQQASTLGAAGTVTALLYVHTPHLYAPAAVSYTPLDPTVRLLPPGQPADGGMWGWLRQIL